MRYLSQLTSLILISLLLVINTGQNVKPQTSNNNSDISILSQTAYLDSGGTFHIIGEVANTSNKTLESVQITASIYDPSHTIIGMGSAFTDIDFLGPGERSGFGLRFSPTDFTNAPPISSYHVSLLSQTTIDQEKPGSLKLTIDRAYIDTTGSYHVVGEVTNQGNVTANSIKVSGVFYDNNHRMIGEGSGYTGKILSSLSRGQTAPFDMRVESIPGQQIVSGAYNVQSQEYSMINNKLPSISSLVSSSITTTQPSSPIDAASAQAIFEKCWNKQPDWVRAAIPPNLKAEWEKEVVSNMTGHNIPHAGLPKSITDIADSFFKELQSC